MFWLNSKQRRPDQTALGEAQILIGKLTEKTLIILLKKQSDQGLLCCFVNQDLHCLSMPCWQATRVQNFRTFTIILALMVK